MDADLGRALRRHIQWFGSYKASGELKKVQVWLIVNRGCIEFLTPADSYKVKRVRRNPRVTCFVGSQDGPAISGTAEVVTSEGDLWRAYRAYWKTHPVLMALLAFSIGGRIKSGRQVMVRVRPDEPNQLAGVTDPAS